MGSGRLGLSDDVEVLDAPRGFAAVGWRWVARLLLLVLVLAGINQLFVRPFRDGTAAPPVIAGIYSAGAAQIAARFTADYLSYVSSAPAGNTAALTADLVSSAGVSKLQVTGAGYVRADLVQVGQIDVVDATHAVVAVTARLRIATPPAGSGTEAVTGGQTDAAGAADPGPVPTGWTDLGSRWLALVVQVEATPAGWRVSAAGPVFSTEPPALLTPPAGSADVDPGTVTATRDVAAAFFTGYATSQVSYLAAPGVTLGGLDRAVTFAALNDWSFTGSGDAAGDANGEMGSGVSVGSVTWRVTGTALAVTQQYTLGMTRSQGRWYAAALAPTRTPAQ